jgi:hypothetical protein
MIVYSKKIFQFINVVKEIIKEVLLREVGLRVRGDRFYDRQQTCSYPIKIVMYDNESKLGYFDSAFYEMGFHESLMNSPREQLYSVIRHELAHYITFIECGAVPSPHSQEFRATCERMGWGEEVQRATILLESKPRDSQENESDVLRKVKKLLSLASSSNVHEAENAMLKSQQLLLKHHLEAPISDGEDGEKVVLKRIMKQKRIDAKGRAVGRILQTFFVNIVYSRAGEYTYLEVLGDAVNVDIAEYVASVLDHEFESMWKQAQKGAGLRGKIARNSFFSGLAIGYCNKVQSLNRSSTDDSTHALMVIEKKLTHAKAMAYPHLSSSKSGARYCHDASMLGERMGKQLNINPAIKKPSDSAETLYLTRV